MSRIQDPVILYQYKTAPKLSALLEGTKQFLIDNSKEDIFRFFNIDEAVGLWLDQLGAYLDVDRPLITVSPNSTLFQLQDGSPFQLQDGSAFIFNSSSVDVGAFIMDMSLMDGPDLLDGTSFANDEIYRNYIKGQIFKRNSRFTINDIISVLQFTFATNNIFIEEGVKTLKIWMGVNSIQDKINLELLNNLNPKWFGTPSGVGIENFNIYILPINTTFFIMDYNEMDNSNYLMA